MLKPEKYEKYELVEITEIWNLPPATQIAVNSAYEDLHPSLAFFHPLFSIEKFYYHHGVYLGQCIVADFSGPNKSESKPRFRDILDFIRGGADRRLYKVKYDDSVKTLPVKETLCRAHMVLGKPEKWPGYQLFNNNCESFATWLMTGEMCSAQITRALIRVVPLVASAAAAFSASASIAVNESPANAVVGAVVAGTASYVAVSNNLSESLDRDNTAQEQLLNPEAYVPVHKMPKTTIHY